VISAANHHDERFIEIPGLFQTGLYSRATFEKHVSRFNDLPEWPIDMDTWLRLLGAGLEVSKIPRELYGWRQHGTQSTRHHGRCSTENLRLCKAFHLRRAMPGTTAIQIFSIGSTLEGWAATFAELESKVGSDKPWSQQLRDAYGDDAVAFPHAAVQAIKWNPKKEKFPSVPINDTTARIFVYSNANVRRQVVDTVHGSRWGSLDWLAA